MNKIEEREKGGMKWGREEGRKDGRKEGEERKKKEGRKVGNFQCLLSIRTAVLIKVIDYKMK